MTFGDRSKWWLHFGLLIAVAGCERDRTYDEKPIGKVVEIKTPQTALLGAPYRNILPPSSELIGAISQVLQYKESLMQELHSLQHESPQLSGAEPYCVIIAGSASRELTDDVKRRSFERFRERVTGVRILTFDEVFSRIEDLVKLLENAEELPQRTA